MSRRNPRRRSPQLSANAPSGGSGVSSRSKVEPAPYHVISDEELVQRLIDSGATPVAARRAAGLPEILPEREILAARHLGLDDLGRTIEIAAGPARPEHPGTNLYAGVLVGYRPGSTGNSYTNAQRVLVLRYGTVTESVTVDLNAKITALPRPANH